MSKIVVEIDDTHLPFVRQQVRLHGPDEPVLPEHSGHQLLMTEEL